MRNKSYKIFFLFCGILYPIIVGGALYISFDHNLWLGIFTSAILIYWLVYSFSTTCCRCQFYGSSKCGIPGIVVPYFFKKKSIFDLPKWRIWVNFYNDIILMIYLNLIYILEPFLFPFILAATVLVYKTVYRKKKFHGLMHVLRKKPQRNKALKLKIL